MDAAGRRIDRLKSTAVEEGRKLFRIFLYLWVVLTLFSLHKAFIFNEDLLTYQQGFALINAFALAKVILIGQSFHLGESDRGRPLIYPIVIQTAIFTVILVLFHIAEETAIGVWHGRTAAESVPQFGDGTLQAVLMVGIILFFALMPFFAFVELERTLGAKTMSRLIFGRSDEPEAR